MLAGLVDHQLMIHNNPQGAVEFRIMGHRQYRTNGHPKPKDRYFCNFTYALIDRNEKDGGCTFHQNTLRSEIVADPSQFIQIVYFTFLFIWK